MLEMPMSTISSPRLSRHFLLKMSLRVSASSMVCICRAL